ncbi:DUF1049 domain-containing protein [Ectothiorhodospiraceae bacterium 2226]|nr:DUF1049 domain-containing protein [Ectothiorhodospiraceae bacterium 2226]
MKRIAAFLVILLVVVFGLTFAVLNAQPVRFDYYFGGGEVPLALLLAVALVVGALLGVLASLGVMLGLRRDLGRMRRRAQVSEKELRNLRALPLKDTH